MQIFDNSLQLDGKCEIIVFIRQQVKEKLAFHTEFISFYFDDFSLFTGTIAFIL